MNEFSLINKIKQKNYKQAGLIKGVGDDAAVFSNNNSHIVTAIDTFTENVHFTKKTLSSKQIGYRVLAANLSDLAAMGAKPAYYLVSIVIPDNWTESNILSIFQGMNEIASRYHVDLIGGDTVSGEKLTVTVTVIGLCHPKKVRYRSDAQAGDIVFITGTLGDAQAGLYSLVNDEVSVQDKAYFIKRHQRPTPRITFSNLLENVKRLSLNDISDGITNEAAEIAEASQVTIHLCDENIPIHPSLQQFPYQLKNNWIYNGGEDFELIGTVAREEWAKVKEAANKTKTPITKVGYVTYNSETNGNVYLWKNNKKERLIKKGYTHLSRR